MGRMRVNVVDSSRETHIEFRLRKKLAIPHGDFPGQPGHFDEHQKRRSRRNYARVDDRPTSDINVDRHPRIRRKHEGREYDAARTKNGKEYPPTDSLAV
jgi:hypothetical protein